MKEDFPSFLAGEILSASLSFTAAGVTVTSFGHPFHGRGCGTASGLARGDEFAGVGVAADIEGLAAAAAGM